MPPFTPLPLAIVELSASPALAAVLVFVATFLLVAVVGAWLLFRNRKPGPGGTITWQIDVTQRLPVSPAAGDRIADLTRAALSRPAPTPERQAFSDGLADMRRTLVAGYRLTLIAVGLFGIVVALLWFQRATPANMEALPASIVLLLSLGALLNGLVASRSLTRKVEPLDPRLFDKIQVQVSNKPITVRLDEFAMLKAADLLRQGASADEAARAVYSEYDRLTEFERTAVREAIAEAVRRSSS